MKPPAQITNNGTEYVSFEQGWYFSANNYITNWYDEFAGDLWISMPNNVDVTLQSKITVPETVAYNQTYFTGNYLDHKEDTPEWYETDNRTIEGVKISVLPETMCP